MEKHRHAFASKLGFSADGNGGGGGYAITGHAYIPLHSTPHTIPEAAAPQVHTCQDMQMCSAHISTLHFIFLDTGIIPDSTGRAWAKTNRRRLMQIRFLTSTQVSGEKKKEDLPPPPRPRLRGLPKGGRHNRLDHCPH